MKKLRVNDFSFILFATMMMYSWNALAQGNTNDSTTATKESKYVFSYDYPTEVGIYESATFHFYSTDGVDSTAESFSIEFRDEKTGLDKKKTSYRYALSIYDPDTIIKHTTTIFWSDSNISATTKMKLAGRTTCIRTSEKTEDMDIVRLGNVFFRDEYRWTDHVGEELCNFLNELVIEGMPQKEVSDTLRYKRVNVSQSTDATEKFEKLIGSYIYPKKVGNNDNTVLSFYTTDNDDSTAEILKIAYKMRRFDGTSRTGDGESQSVYRDKIYTLSLDSMLKYTETLIWPNRQFSRTSYRLVGKTDYILSSPFLENGDTLKGVEPKRVRRGYYSRKHWVDKEFCEYIIKLTEGQIPYAEASDTTIFTKEDLEEWERMKK